MTKPNLIINLKPTKKQRIMWKLLNDDKTKFLLFGGGAGGAKSWLGCEWLLTMCAKYPGTKWFIGRNELKRLMGSTYITMLKVFRWHKIPPTAYKLNSQYNYIEFWNGSRIDLIDVAYKPNDPMYERFGSLEYTGGWLEEVGEIKKKAFEMLKSRIGRHMNKEYNIMSKVFLTCNPKKNWVYHKFYKPWKEDKLDDNCCFIQSLYNDNPYTASEYGENLKSIEDPVLRERLMNGNWEYSEDDSNLMQYEKIINIFSNQFVKDLGGNTYLTVDPARFGKDRAVLILWHGFYIKKIWFYDKSNQKWLQEKIESICQQHHIPYSNVAIDEDGIGGGLVDNLYGVVGFLNGSSPVEEVFENIQETKKYGYKNLRSQCYFKLSEKVNKNQIGCYPEIPEDVKELIIQELEAIKRKDCEQNEKKLQVIGKDEIKENIGHSPDFSDCMMQRMIFELGERAVGEVGVVW